MIFKRSIIAAVGALALTVTMGGTATAAEGTALDTEDAARQAPVTFGASAWGSKVKVAGPLLNSGKTAYIALGCTHKDNISKTNDTAGVDIPELVDLGAVTSTVTTDRSSGPTYTSTGHSTIAEASVFAGEIELGAIETIASVSEGPDGFTTDVDFEIASLTIAGEEIEIDDDEEQVIDIDGIAEITLNKQKTSIKRNKATASGTAVTIELLGPGGATIKLGEARAEIDSRIVNGFFTGGAYGTKVTVLDTVESGKTANKPLSCVGTKGKDKTNEVATLDLEGVGEVNGIVSTVNGDQTPRPDARVSNEIAEVELLAGLATIEAITTEVHVFEMPNGDIEYEADASIGGIRVGLITIDVPDEPGATVDLPGIGTLTFMEVTELKGGRGVEVIGARLTLDNGDTDVVLSRSAATIK